MSWYSPIKIFDKEYCFKDVEDEPLILEMKITDKITVIRNINCDEPTEYIDIRTEYTKIMNSIHHTDYNYTRVYTGKEISDSAFMKQLLEHVLIDIN